MLKFIAFLGLFVLVVGGKSPHGEEYLSQLSAEERSAIPREIAEDALLDVVGLITKYGYPAETHEVQTEDGYLLTMHRIPSGKLNKASRGPVFLMHGMASSSADYITNGPERALGYILADEGYDVWMGNARGNYYSRNHITHDPEGRRFWMFSWNEIGFYDLPAMIDYILENTGQEKLHYIGHSQGTTSFFVMSSRRPEYNAKIKLMQALAPVAYNSNQKSPLFKYLAPYMNEMQVLLTLLGSNEMFTKSDFITEMAHEICVEDSPYLSVCKSFLFLLGASSFDQTNMTMVPIYLGHTPAGISSRQMVHYGQLYQSAQFRQYDHGFFGNLAVHNRFTPPRYNLNRITAPVALHYSDNDWLAEPIDVFQLHDELANSIGLFRVPFDTFTHLDFLWAIDSKTLLYDLVIELMKTYD